MSFVILCYVTREAFSCTETSHFRFKSAASWVSNSWEWGRGSASSKVATSSYKFPMAYGCSKFFMLPLNFAKMGISIAVFLEKKFLTRQKNFSSRLKFKRHNTVGFSYSLSAAESCVRLCSLALSIGRHIMFLGRF